MAKGNYLRALRQLILLTILLAIAAGSYLTRTRSTSWEEPLWVTLYPIAADDRPITQETVRNLTNKTFADIEAFMERETRRYGVPISRPIRIDIGQPVATQPPAPPDSRNPVRVALWSLGLRWWAWRSTRDQPGATPDIRLFLVYHDPELRPRVPHSLGMREGLIGVVHVFADRRMHKQNNVVIAHEMLHTLGASDKYSPDDNLPLYPIGFAEPDREPRYPQSSAEIMGGRIPLSATEAVIPDNLREVRVGPYTALEIRWIEAL